MKKRIITFCFLIISLLFFYNVSAQRATDFERAFQKAAETGFDSVTVEELFKKHGALLMPFNQPTQLAMAMKGQQWVRFPLAGMVKKTIYQDNINSLLDSPQPSKRLLGYFMVAASGDFGKRNRLSRDLRSGSYPTIELWLGMALMHIGYDHTSDLFRWVVRNNTSSGGYLFPLFIALPKDSLRRTAFKFAKSKDWNERVYAVQTLEYTGSNKQTEQILRKAIITWPVHLKGYAIVPAQALQIGQLLPALKPVLDSSATRKVSLDALADSPTLSDRAFVAQLANKNPDHDIFNAMKTSRHPEMVIEWLRHLPALDEKYFFTVHRDSIIRTDALLPMVQKIAIAVKNPAVLSHLLPALKGRVDSVSQQILVGFLSSRDEIVRAAAGTTLLGSCTDLVKTALPAIIENPQLISSSIFNLAADCGLDSFQLAAETVYRSSTQQHFTRMTALDYLATYPRPAHLLLFRDALQMDPEQESWQIRTAARGLAALGDTASTEAIIEACERERKNSDMNTFVYLDALAKLKSDRCKNYLESFLKSDSDVVVKTVASLLENW